MMKRLLTTAASLCLLLAGFAGEGAANTRDMTPGHLCLAEAMKWEKKLDTPDGLVRAMALAETGRWDALDGRSIPWPWTVNNGGAGTFYATKKEAIKAVRALQRQGETNIDVGCMQVNLGWHGDNFRSLEEAFEPQVNMVVAARILQRQYRAHRDWDVAAGNYHSATPHFHQRYRKKVKALLASLDQRAPLTLTPDLHAALQDMDPRVAARKPGRASRPHWARQGGSGIAQVRQQAAAPVNPVSRSRTGAARGLSLADYRAMARPKAAKTRGLNLVRQ
ncbi:MAG: hypothetical protein NXI16_15240 [Alphaproteobacteria bacterium]|nr:hypothetical protein [Alphaproteobacteria bacterium]